MGGGPAPCGDRTRDPLPTSKGNPGAWGRVFGRPSEVHRTSTGCAGPPAEGRSGGYRLPVVASLMVLSAARLCIAPAWAANTKVHRRPRSRTADQGRGGSLIAGNGHGFPGGSWRRANHTKAGNS